jgi:hypothetical protein
MLDVRRSRELQATILTLKQAERSIRLDINKTARRELTPVWRRELNRRARTRLEQRVIAGAARVTASNRGMTFYAATSNRPLRGGLIPADDWPAVEFGANIRRVQVSQRSRAGRRYTRPLTINRQFFAREQNGMIAFDAASTAGTQLVALWVRTVVDELRDVAGVEVTG